MSKRLKKSVLLAMLTALIAILAACSASGKENEKVVLYSNGDEEAVAAMESSLDEAGYEGEYVIQSLGTSELGGKLLAEGAKMEADLVTMSSYFVESAQEQSDMFSNITVESEPLKNHPSYYAPLISNTGAIFVNTKMLEEKGLKIPMSIKDLTQPEFKGLVSIPDLNHSSTGWLLVQAIISEYGETEGKAVLSKLIENVGPHLERSGSGSIKKVKAGEAAVGFGLRHQAIQAKESGLPIDYVDPEEGNFSLTESIAVVDKDSKKTDLAMEMARVIVKDAREELIKYYPVPLYKDETVGGENIPSHPKEFSEPLTVELLKQHQDFFNAAIHQ